MPTIHEATRAADDTGGVLKGKEIDEATAVALRRAGKDVVVCGDDLVASRELAKAIESTVGPYERQRPHTELAGPAALPHFQQRSSQPLGHTFYETSTRKARRKS